MDIWNQLSPELRDFLFAAAADATGGLIGSFVESLLRSGGRRVRERFAKLEAEQALERAAGAAITAVIADWQQAHPDYADLWARFGAWLLNPAVLTEFRTLLTPSVDATFDMELLRDEFEAAGLDVAHLGDEDFDGLIQTMVGEFYVVAATETALQGPLQIGLLRQMAEQMGALEQLAARQTDLSRRSLGQLERLNLVADRVADGHDETNLLLREILIVLREDRPQPIPELQQFYEQIRRVLSRADLGDFYDVELGERAYGVAIGDHAHVEITNDFVQVQHLLTEIRDHLVAAQPQLTREELAALERHYRQSLIDRFEKLTFRGITPSGTALSLKLADVYVELKAVADIPEAADTYSADERRLLLEASEWGDGAHQETVARLDALRLERWRDDARRQREEGSRFQRRSIGEMVADLRQRGLVILGDPGSGKSTLLHYLALIYAGEYQQIKTMTLLEKPLPIFVPLAAYDDHLRRTTQALPLGEFLAIYYEKWRNLPSLAPLFQAALEQGRALLLFDGLDEVLETTTRQFVAEQAGTLIQRWQGRGNRFVVTSRVVGYREARLPGDLPHVTVLDFGRPEIETFAHQWCRAYEVWAAGRETPTALQQAAAEEAALLDDVRSSPSVEQLAANPLLLTMLALLRRQVGKLPDRRIELYERYTRTLIDNREQERSRGARQQSPSRFDPHRAIAHLMDLALWLQMHRPSGTARRIDLERALVDICLHYDGHTPSQVTEKMRIQARKEAEAFLTDMRHFAGLLGERGRDTFGFLHLTFQEYFVGRALARMNAEQRWSILQPHLHLPRWREPILLCAGQLGVIEQRRDLVSDLVQRILDTKSAYEKLLHRDLFLAAAVMADDVGLESQLLEQIYECLQPLQQDKVPTIQNLAITALSHLACIGYKPAFQELLYGLGKTNLQEAVICNSKPLLLKASNIQMRHIIVSNLTHRNSRVRLACVHALAPLALKDTYVQAAIMSRVQDEDFYMGNAEVGWAAAEILRDVVKDNVELKRIVTINLADRREYVRARAVRILSSLVPIDKTVQSNIVKCLNDNTLSVRSEAVVALSTVLAHDKTVRSKILNILKHDHDGIVKCQAMRSLSSVLTIDEIIQEEIQSYLHDSDPYLICTAIEVLSKLILSNEAVRTKICHILETSDNPDVRFAAIDALGKVVIDEPIIKEVIFKRLQDDDGSVRHAAVKSLFPLVNDKVVKDKLQQLLDDESYNDIRPNVIEALSSLAANNISVKEAILEYLTYNETQVRAAAVRALSSLVTDDTVRSRILLLLNDDEPILRYEAVQALSALVQSDETIKKHIFRALSDENNIVRSAAVNALYSVAASDEAVRAYICNCLTDNNAYVRTQALGALVELSFSNSKENSWLSTDEFMVKIFQCLEDSDANVRNRTMLFLQPLVNKDVRAKSAILACLNNDDRLVREVAVACLRPFLHEDVDVRNAILAKLDDNDCRVQQAAIRALLSFAHNDKSVMNIVEALFENEYRHLWPTVIQIYFERKSNFSLSTQYNVINRNNRIEGWLDFVPDNFDRTVNYRVKNELSDILFDKTRIPVDDSNQVEFQLVLTELLNAEWWRERYLAVRILANMVQHDPSVWDAVFSKLDDEDWCVRYAAIQALAVRAVDDTRLRNKIIAKIEDENRFVRLASIKLLAPLIPHDASIKELLLDWLGADIDWEWETSDREGLLRLLTKQYGSILMDNPELMNKVITMLDSPIWRTRKSALYTLMSIPNGLSLYLLPKVHNLFNDMRDHKSWLLRLQIAELFVNHHDKEVSRYSINLIIRALDYATKAEEKGWKDGSKVRKQAVSILGQLDASSYDDVIFTKLAQVMQTDQDPDVCDAAYGALLRLAAALEATVDVYPNG